jgi:hypothetical protein
LLNKSVSDDSEKNMISKLKVWYWFKVVTGWVGEVCYRIYDTHL